MRQTATFLSGVAASLAGAFIRSCQPAIVDKLANAWCGPAPANPFTTSLHAHCAGCVTLFIGLALIGATLIRSVMLAASRIRK